MSENKPTTSSDKSDATDQEEIEKGKDEEDGVTMLEVLEDEEALEDDAAAVLGNVSDDSCSYSQGYMSRQPLYACKDCSDEGSPPAGVCLACSYHCHEGHNLVELYTKRNFRCDCGLSKMKCDCKLELSKEANTRNRYNQNFRGLYCTCHRPYPDPEDSVEDLMIQCVVCEDWLHGRHLNMENNDLPGDDEYAEMICHDCVNKLEFLHSYSGLTVTRVKKTSDNTEVKVDDTETVNVQKKEENIETSDDKCKLKAGKCEKCEDDVVMKGSFFLPQNWRQSLCRCSECVQMYEDLNVSFLTDDQDTVYYYESQAKLEKKNSFDSGMEALSSMDRVKQMEAIHGYNNMKQNLMQYLSKFADNKKVVREEDIKEFFQSMSNKKRRL